MSTKPLANRLDEITRSLTEQVARQAERIQAQEASLRAHRAELTAHEMPATRRVPAPPPSPLVSARIRSLIQEEARLHWHHRDLPVSKFAGCMLLPG